MATTMKLLLGAAALIAALSFDSPASRAGGNAPWCGVVDYGDGGVTWECVYRSFAECYPNVIAGNKGSCNLNPYGPGPQPPAVAQRKHPKRHAQQ